MNIEMVNTFDIYFATLVGMAMHPGYSRDNVEQPSLEQCAATANKMLRIRSLYINEDEEGVR